MTLAACDDGAGGDHTGTEAGPDSPLTTPIVYQVRGVYPPFLHRVVIDPDGRATITTRSALKPGGARRRIVELPTSRLALIGRELAAADLAAIDDEGPPTCMDCPEYTVEFDGERVAMAEADVPKRLRSAIGRLKRVLRRASQSPD